MQELQQFWESHYQQLFARGPSWLDYSNERVQLTTFGLCLEASGGVAGRSCLDLGCGRAQFTRMLACCGGRVTGVDLLPEVIEAHRAQEPNIDWRVGNLLDVSFATRLGTFERVFALEVLQCVPWLDVLPRVWERVGPGGRLVAMIPCGDCPIVQRVVGEHEGLFSAPRIAELVKALASLPGAARWNYRGLTFAEDQWLAPYVISSWKGEAAVPLAETAAPISPPNRLLFVAERG